ncbi:MAG: hypothetical protein PF568_07700 [Deltaproteobacteria bacterium]|jgi:hypothetical protein|nr:hypothetical protein [Deltaproteobacteria bacterium]
MIRPLGFIFACTLFFLPACADRSGQGNNEMNRESAAKVSLESIVVLQCEHDRVDSGNNSAASHRLDQGCQVLNTLVAEYFALQENVTLLSAGQQEALMGTFIGDLHQRARHIGRGAQGDAVLVTNLNTYQQLEGTKYGADEPASVGFDYSLIHVESGLILCRGSYQETQKTLLSDLFSFGKASRRHFQFVSAETLLQEGVVRKFSDCPHLANP